MIQTQGLSKRFHDPKRGAIDAVVDVTWRAEPGKIFGLLGINGAGKTTFMRMLSTILEPTSGTAEIAGYDINTDGQKIRQSIGFLSASTALYQRLTPMELLRYFGGLYGLGSERLAERLNFVTEKLNLYDFHRQLCDKLSTGQKQRVSIARAILHDPPVLFFDEPTVGLDVVTSQTIMEFIEETRHLGKTIVYSTHIMSEAERLCDNVTIIHQGHIKGQGSVEELKARTATSSLEAAFLAMVGYQHGQGTAK